jgi:hypothetical protein
VSRVIRIVTFCKQSVVLLLPAVRTLPVLGSLTPRHGSSAIPEDELLN